MYKDRAAFFVVYIREAHPSDAWQMAVNVKDNVVFTDPRTIGERTAVAESCVRKLGIRIPALVDDVGDGVEGAYAGWPDRLYVIGGDGRVKYKSAPGPYGFRPMAMEQSLQTVLNERKPK
jgi:hypothetical protein